MSVDTKMIRLTLELSAEAHEQLLEMAREADCDVSDVLRRAIAIYEVAVRAKKAGQKFGVASADQTLETEIIGL